MSEVLLIFPFSSLETFYTGLLNIDQTKYCRILFYYFIVNWSRPMKIFLAVIVYITTTYRVERLVRRTITNMAAGGP